MELANGGPVSLREIGHSTSAFAIEPNLRENLEFRFQFARSNFNNEKTINKFALGEFAMAQLAP